MSRRFFYDFEFMEEPGFLEMISVGVVDEYGEREKDLSRQPTPRQKQDLVG